jgi:hypothetical protein
MATDENDFQERFGAGLPPPSPKRPQRSLFARSSSVEVEIGKKMRAMYDGLLEQPIPDRFVQLLKQIDLAQENKSQ